MNGQRPGLDFLVSFIRNYLQEIREPALVIARVNGRDTAAAENLIFEEIYNFCLLHHI